MGTSLNGLTPAGTYPGLIKTGDNAPIDGTLKTLSDGNGNNLPMAVSTTTINLTGTAQVGGVAIANTTQVAAKQDTLVSGTNIKTINGTSVLGSGDIVTPSTPPSGVAGAIQFSNGSAFASDAANLFWDDTNNRLGVGTNTPSKSLHIRTQHGVANGILLNSQNACGITITGDDYPNELIISKSNAQFGIATNGFLNISSTEGLTINNPTIKGSGSTSATTSLLVQNSDGDLSFQVKDSQLVQGFSGSLVRFKLGFNGTVGQAISTRDGQFAIGLIDTDQLAAIRFLTLGTGASYIDAYSEGTSKAANYPLFIGSRTNNTSTLVTGSTTQENGTPVVFGSAVYDASALVQINSTTRGFLPPRMTTTEKNAIATPASGLVVYDSTTNKLCCYNGSTWNDLF